MNVLQKALEKPNNIKDGLTKLLLEAQLETGQQKFGTELQDGRTITANVIKQHDEATHVEQDNIDDIADSLDGIDPSNVIIINCNLIPDTLPRLLELSMSEAVYNEQALGGAIKALRKRVANLKHRTGGIMNKMLTDIADMSERLSAAQKVEADILAGLTSEGEYKLVRDHLIEVCRHHSNLWSGKPVPSEFQDGSGLRGGTLCQYCIVVDEYDASKRCHADCESISFSEEAIGPHIDNLLKTGEAFIMATGNGDDTRVVKIYIDFWKDS